MEALWLFQKAPVRISAAKSLLNVPYEGKFLASEGNFIMLLLAVYDILPYEYQLLWTK